MPMDNSLNVSELLKRLGVVGDSKGSAPLLNELRLAIQIADMSQLVAPLAGPMVGASDQSTSGGGLFNKWAIRCQSPGGLTVGEIVSNSERDYFVFVLDFDPFVGSVVEPICNMSFGQPAQSQFINAPAAAAVALAHANRFIIRTDDKTQQVMNFNWIGPGEFFCIESRAAGVNTELMSVVWREYPAMVNP